MSYNASENSTARYDVVPKRGSWITDPLSRQLSDVPLYLFIMVAAVLVGYASGALRVGSDSLFVKSYGGDGASWFLTVSNMLSLTLGTYVLITGRSRPAEYLLIRSLYMITAMLVIPMVAAWFVQTPFAWFIWACTSRSGGQLLTVNFFVFLSLILDLRETKKTLSTITTVVTTVTLFAALVAPTITQVFGHIDASLSIGTLAAVTGVLAIVAVSKFRKERFNIAAPVKKPGKDVPQEGLISALFGTRYARLNVALVCFAGVVVALIEFLYLSNINTFFTTETSQAAFISYFYAASTLSGILCGIFLMPILLKHFSLQPGLQLQPIWMILVVIPGLFFVPASMAPFVLAIGVFAAHWGNRVFGGRLSRPYQRILVMPLEPKRRVILQNFQASIAVPGAGLAGSLMISAIAILATDPVETMALLFVIFCVGWFFMNRIVTNEYQVALTAALAKRRGGHGDTELFTPETRSIFFERLRTGTPEDILFCLDTMPSFELRSEDGIIRMLLGHDDARIRRRILGFLEEHELAEFVSDVKAHTEAETDEETLALAFRTLVSLTDEDAAVELLPLASARSRPMKLNLAVALLKHAGIEGIIEAGSFVTDHAKSKDPEDRRLAAEIIAGSGLKQLARPLRPLIKDSNSTVALTAIGAAGEIGSDKLIRPLIDKLPDPLLHAASQKTLIKMGSRAVDPLITAVDDEGSSLAVKRRIIDALARINSAPSRRFLIGRLDFANLPVRRIVAEVVAREAISCPPKSLPKVEAALLDELSSIAWLAEAQRDLQSAHFRISTLFQALAEEIQQARFAMLDLLSLMYDRDEIGTIRHNLFSGVSAKRAIAVERLSSLLKRENKNALIAAIEEDDPKILVEHLSAHLTGQNLRAEDRVEELISYPSGLISPWTKACALLLAGENKFAHCADGAILASNDPEPILRETALWAIFQIAQADIDAWQKARETAEAYMFDDDIFVSRTAMHIVNAISASQPEDTGHEHTQLQITKLRRARMPLLVEKVLLLKRNPYFSAMGESELAELASQMDEIDLIQRTTIVKAGEPINGIYVVVYGNVRLRTDLGADRLLKGGDTFGIEFLFSDRPIDFTAMTEGDCLLLQISEEHLSDLMATNVEVAKGLIRALGSANADMEQTAATAA